MKLAAFLTSILPAAVFKDPDLPVVLSAPTLNDIDIPDGVASQFNAHYMTPDRAYNDSTVGNIWKSKLWGYFADDQEKEMKDLVGYMPQEYQDKYKAVPKGEKNGIYTRMAILKEGLSKVAEGGQSEDVKQQAAKWREKEKEWHDKDAAKDARIKEIESDRDNQINDFKIDFHLKDKYRSFFPKLDETLLKDDTYKNFIIEKNLADVRRDFLLEFDPQTPGALKLLKKDRSEYYEGNELVTLDKFIEKQLEPFTVKNGGGATNPASGVKVKTKEVNTGNMVVTVKDRRFAAAGAEAQA